MEAKKESKKLGGIMKYIIAVRLNAKKNQLKNHLYSFKTKKAAMSFIKDLKDHYPNLDYMIARNYEA